MFEAIDSDSLAADEPVSSWLGLRLLDNTRALADRGLSGSYVFALGGGGTSGASSFPTPTVSTHPDYWYSVPFILPESPFQTRLVVRMAIQVIGSVELAVWCEGKASTPATYTTGDTRAELVLTLPERAARVPARCAILIRSIDGGSETTGTVVDSSVFGFRTDTTAVSTSVDFGQFHRLLVLSSSGSGDLENVDAVTRYHVTRARTWSDTLGLLFDEFEVWPAVDRALRLSDPPVGVDVDVRFLGQLQVFSVQVAVDDGAVPGLPLASDVHPGEVVRAETIRRIARAQSDILTTQGQVCWLGGVTAPRLFWGALSSEPGASVTLVETQVRARSHVNGVWVAVLYATEVANLEVTIDGVTTTFDLPRSGAPQARDTAEAPGLLAWANSRLFLGTCSSLDLSFHGSDEAGLIGDVSRFGLFKVFVPFDSAPVAGSLVPVTVKVERRSMVYVGAVTVYESTLPDASWPAVGPPPAVLYGEIDQTQPAGIAARQLELYESRLRVAYAVDRALIMGNGGSAGLSFRTSPDLPAGTVLRFTIRAELATVTCAVDATTANLVFTAVAELTTDIAVASDTVYTVVVSCAAGVGAKVYRIRIEEFLP